MFKIGDQVSVITESIQGKVIQIDKKQITIEDQDGFNRSYGHEMLVADNRRINYSLSTSETEQMIIEKINASLQRTEQGVISKKNVKRTNFEQEVHEVDLHIDSLTTDFDYMSNSEILQRQMMTCRIFMERVIDQKSDKAVLIHGKGEGVLRAEIYAYLNRLENTKPIQINYSDASFSKYGSGATEVTIKYS